MFKRILIVLLSLILIFSVFTDWVKAEQALFYKEVNIFLNKNSTKVTKLKTFFENNLENDLYFNFFGSDTSYEANEDKKNINNFKYKNLFKKIPKNYKEIYKNRISFFKVIK